MRTSAPTLEGNDVTNLDKSRSATSCEVNVDNRHVRRAIGYMSESTMASSHQPHPTNRHSVLVATLPAGAVLFTLFLAHLVIGGGCVLGVPNA